MSGNCSVLRTESPGTSEAGDTNGTTITGSDRIQPPRRTGSDNTISCAVNISSQSLKKWISIIALMGLVALIVLIACHHKKAGSVIKNFINKDSTNSLAISAGAGGAAALALAWDCIQAKKAVAFHEGEVFDAISVIETRDSATNTDTQTKEVDAVADKFQKENWSLYQIIMAVLAIAFIGLAVNKAIPKSAQHIYQKVMEGIGVGAAIPVICGLLKVLLS